MCVGYLCLKLVPLLLREGSVATLAPRRELPPGDYRVLMRIYDASMLYQESTLMVEVCQCQGSVSTCFMPRSDPQLDGPSLATSVLGGIFLLLCTWLFSHNVTLDFHFIILSFSLFNWAISSICHSAAFVFGFVAEEELQAHKGCCPAGGIAPGQYLLL